jgi:hypothetical protein
MDGRAHMSEVVAAIEAAAPGARVDYDDAIRLPFPEELETGCLDEVLGAVPRS